MGEFFANKSLRLLGGDVFEKKKECEKKKSCLILSFGDYYQNNWCPADILLYRFVLLIVILTYALIVISTG